MCLYPKLILNPKYKANKKNGWQAPPVTDNRIEYVPIGCQMCLECKKKKSIEWKVRLSEEIKNDTRGKFITLTFSQEKLEELQNEIREKATKDGKDEPTGYQLENETATLAIRRFLERHRWNYKKSIKHWLITELGHQGTERPHLHGILWTDKTLEEIEKIWQYGWVWKGNEENGEIINYVNEKTINYIIKYVTKVDEIHPTYKAIILTSPGIGKGYENTWNASKNKYNENGKTDETYKTRQGARLGLPIYYRNKIYTEEEREKLWIQKLDQMRRYIRGVEVDISKGLKEYEDGLKIAQEFNIQMGYGTGETNWDEEQYKRQQRIIENATKKQKLLKQQKE